MQKISFQCETITPMFMSGADGSSPELRAPSIKGAIRFWWRAMHGNLDLEDLKNREAKIFGGSGEKEGKSNVIIKITKYLEYDGKYVNYPTPHNKRFDQPAFRPSKEFKIILFLKRKIEFDDVRFGIEQLKSLFRLISILGGLGRRSRRGFGSFKITEINEEPFTEDITTENIKKLIETINPDFAWNHTYLNSYFPYLKNIQFGKKNNYEELLKKIGEESHNYDCYYSGFAGKIKNGDRKNSYRFSSPVYISIIENSNTQNQIIITELNYAFEIGLNGNFLIKKNAKGFNYTDIESKLKFIEELK